MPVLWHAQNLHAGVLELVQCHCFGEEMDASCKRKNDNGDLFDDAECFFINYNLYSICYL